jgi:hypothetical protein
VLVVAVQLLPCTLPTNMQKQGWKHQRNEPSCQVTAVLAETATDFLKRKPGTSPVCKQCQAEGTTVFRQPHSNPMRACYLHNNSLQH